MTVAATNFLDSKMHVSSNWAWEDTDTLTSKLTPDNLRTLFLRTFADKASLYPQQWLSFFAKELTVDDLLKTLPTTVLEQVAIKLAIIQLEQQARKNESTEKSLPPNFNIPPQQADIKRDLAIKTMSEKTLKPIKHTTAAAAPTQAPCDTVIDIKTLPPLAKNHSLDVIIDIK